MNMPYGILQNSASPYKSAIMISQSLTLARSLSFYVPGVFTLLLLIPLSISKLLQHPALQRYYALEVNYYSPEDMRPRPASFPPERQYQVINIDGDKAQDKSKLEMAQVTIRKLLHTYDTLTGIRIHFEPTARYESFVTALDICNVEEGIVYVPYKNSLWLFNRFGSLQDRESRFSWHCVIMHPYRHIKPQFMSSVAYAFSYKIDAKYWPSAMLLIALITMTFRRKRHK